MVLAQSDARGIFDGVRDGLDNAWNDVITFAPKLIGAAIILLVGWLIARVIRGVFVRVLDRVGLDKLLDRAGLSHTLRAAGYTASQLVANVLYWIALLVVFLLAAEALQVERLTELISSLISYLPLVAVAMIIIVVTAAIGSFVADLVEPWADRQNIGWLTPAVRFSIIGFGVIAALNTLNVAETVVNTLFTAIVATIGLMIAIAGGVGGIKRAESMWWSVFPDKTTNRS